MPGIFRTIKFKNMELKSIPVTELKPGTYFKLSSKQRKFRYAAMTCHFKPGDSEFLRGKILVIQENCRQLLLDEESTVLIVG